MSKISVRLALLNDKGIVAGLEDSDHGFIDLWKHRSQCNPKVACAKAAERLRKLADLFDELSNHETPMQSKVQEKMKGA